MAVEHPDSTRTSGHELACGRTVEQVWAEMETGLVGSHSAACPHCTTARAGLGQLIVATEALIDDPAEPPPGLLDQIMSAVRADLVHTERLPLPAPAGGVDISVHALAAVLRYAVDSVAGLRAHRCRIEPDPDDPAGVWVWMSVSLRYGSGRVDALDEARRRVGATLSQRVGLTLVQLDLELVDVWVDIPGPEEPA